MTKAQEVGLIVYYTILFCFAILFFIYEFTTLAYIMTVLVLLNMFKHIKFTWKQLKNK